MRFSLGKKIVLLLIVFVVVLSSVTIVVTFRAVDSMNDQHYQAKANELSATVARVVDAQSAAKLKDAAWDIYRSLDKHVLSDEWGTPEFEEYVGHFAHLANTPEYQTILQQLRDLQEVNDVNCLYISIVIPQDKLCMYLVDAALEDPCPIGCVDPLYEVNERVISDPSIGFPAYITDTPEYGWLVSSGTPVYDENGEVVCQAFTDMSMDTIKRQQQEYLLGLTGGILGLTAVLSVVTILLVRHFIVGPLNTLSDAASRYCAPDHAERSTFADLDIHTKDEIENLHRSMVQMEHDIDNYIANLLETRARLKDTRLRADKMSDLAHRDALTGARNKLAYNKAIEHLEQEAESGQGGYGIALIDLNDLKPINDQYGHEYGDVCLVRLVNIIRTVFVHSPVFRVGGDEFTVLLTGEDYQNADALVSAFEKAIDEQRTNTALEPWERISAAIGYASREPGGGDASVTFQRADERMYERKKQMKEQSGGRPR